MASIEWYEQEERDLAWREEKREHHLTLFTPDRVEVDQDGVARWRSNGAVPPGDILADWADAGLAFDLAATKKAARAALDDLIERMRKRPVSAEEHFEMRAAFGPGVEVVNVLTGQRYRT